MGVKSALFVVPLGEIEQFICLLLGSLPQLGIRISIGSSIIDPLCHARKLYIY